MSSEITNEPCTCDGAVANYDAVGRTAREKIAARDEAETVASLTADKHSARFLEEEWRKSGVVENAAWLAWRNAVKGETK